MILLSIVSIVLVATFLFILVFLPVRGLFGKMQAFNADRKTLLTDCREMISHQGKYRNDWIGNPRLRGNDKALDAEQGGIDTNVPASIRALKPRYVIIRSDRVEIGLRAPSRSQIVGFAEGASEYGTEMLANGLWYCK